MPSRRAKRSATVIRENTDAIIESYTQETDRNPHFARLNLPKDAKIDHVSWLLRLLVDRLVLIGVFQASITLQ